MGIFGKVLQYLESKSKAFSLTAAIAGRPGGSAWLLFTERATLNAISGPFAQFGPNIKTPCWFEEEIDRSIASVLESQLCQR